MPGRSSRRASWLALLLIMGGSGSLLEGAAGALPLPASSPEWQESADVVGPTIQDVRATPPLARPGEVVSLEARITDPSGVQAAWVLIEAPDVDLNVTLVASGDLWFLNRSWESQGVYRFEILAQDGAGNVNTAIGSFQVQDSLAGAFALLVLFGTLLGVGAGALAYLLVRRRGRG
ncbi:MAG: hypothetical protein ACE5KQ_05540 [Thermoplasmata archaeon]